MYKRILWFLPLLLPVLAFGKSKPENWLQITTPHFIVISNADEKESRHVAGQFERMRLVFHDSFPEMQVDPPSPIVVLAVRNKKDFESLEPPSYLGKGKLELTGLFSRTPDKNYILVRLDAAGDHPYATVYHEYTHLLTSKADAWMPLWLTEGLAEFFENTDIHDKNVLLGEPSPGNIFLLQQKHLLPLTTLLSVNYTSPYYHEEDKASIFYAESWALTHYLKVTDTQAGTHRLSDYVELVSQGIDAVTAAQRAFGDLDQMQKVLDTYVQRDSYKYYFKLATPIYVDESTFQAQSITNPEADAHRADFMAYAGRYDDARALLEEVLREDPNNTLAHETMGYLQFRQDHWDEALKWYGEAVKLDSQSFLAHYYFSSIAMSKGPLDAAIAALVESSLRTSIKLNPAFAPSYDRLGVFLGMQHRNLDEAHRLNLQAVEMDPTNLNYRMDTANILVEMEQYANAVHVITIALKFAKTPAELARGQFFLDQVRNAQAEAERENEIQKQISRDAALPAPGSNSGDPVVDDDLSGIQAPVLSRDGALLRGPRHLVSGTIRNVHCADPAVLDFEIQNGKQLFDLHSDNYYRIRFTTLNFTPRGDLKPCTQLEGEYGKVEFVTSGAKAARNIVSIELQR